MEKKLSLSFILALLLILPFSCDEKLDGNRQKELAELRSNAGFNHEQLGEYVYDYVKYYMVTFDPYEFLDPQIKDEFKTKFEARRKIIDEKGLDYESVLDDLFKEQVYSESQVQILKSQHSELGEFLMTNQPDIDRLWNWFELRDHEVKVSNLLNPEEKSEILEINSISKNLLKYKIENHEDLEASGSDDLRVAACGFWDKAFCYLGLVKSYVGIVTAIIAGNPGKIISAIYNATVETYKVVTSCACNKDFCGPFAGLSFDYKCYYPGNSLSFIGWGHGTKNPTGYGWFFYNNDFTITSQFYGAAGNYPTQPNMTVPPEKLTQNNVTKIGVEAQVLCNGIPNVSRHGFWTLANLGKPLGVVSGASNIPVWETDYYVSHHYQLTGPLNSAPDVTYQWQIVSPGYPGYSASGTIIGSGNQSAVSVNWNNTKGVVNLRCTASTGCGSTLYNYSIHIY